MSSTIFFFLFIPLLAFILLAINLIFAPHNPYMEKNSAFECGFSSFLGQNRTQFSISFFIFALLFLLFDLEILLVYPYLVSAYTNGIYGLTMLLLFLLALTLGFAFELGKKALSIDSRQTSSTPNLKSKNIDNIALIGPTKPIKSGANGFVAAMCGLAMASQLPMQVQMQGQVKAPESVYDFDTIRSSYLASTLPSVPTHEPLPSVPTHEPWVSNNETGLAVSSLEVSAPSIDSSLEVSTPDVDLLGVSREFAIESDLIKQKLTKNNWIKNDTELVESDKLSVLESNNLFDSWLENLFSYWTNLSENHLSILNDFVSNNQSAFLAIITLASLVTIFTFLFKLVKNLAKFFKFIFKSIDKTISSGKSKKNKKTKLSLKKTLLGTCLAITQIGKVLSSPRSNKNKQGQGQPEITWADPVYGPDSQSSQSSQAGYQQVRWGGNRSITREREFMINSSRNTFEAGADYITPSSNTQVYAAQTNVNPAFEELTESMEWKAFCLESIDLLATDEYPSHQDGKDIMATADKLLSSLENPSNHNKLIGHVFSKKDLQDLFKQFPVKKSENMYSEPKLLEFAAHALHFTAKSLILGDDKDFVSTMWIQGPDRDSQPSEINTSEKFFGCGREMYNLKLNMEQALHIEHKIKTSGLGDFPFTPFMADEKCGVNFRNLNNSYFMRTVLQDKPKTLDRIVEFLLEVSDPKFISYMFKSSDADALRMINLLIVKAESIRLGHNRRCHYHLKLKEFFEKLGIDTTQGSPISTYHSNNRNRNDVLETKVFTWAIGTNLLYKELRCHLLDEHKRILNQKLSNNANAGNSAQNIDSIKLGEIHVPRYYDILLEEFFKKNGNFLSRDSYRPLKRTISYDTVSINAELGKAIDDFTLPHNFSW